MQTEISLRDYFAAHVPEAVLHTVHIDTSHTRLPMPDPADPKFNLTDAEQGYVKSWMRDPCWDLEGNLASFQAACKEVREKNALLARQALFEGYAKAAYEYADTMLR